MTENFAGYDISPDMVRLSRVNMYLHKFTKPQISEYDTLSNLDKWDETYDVILANPPFMTPKGGIIPHNRYRIQAKRAEVLFVDYIAEHLNPTGKAGVIVPEGIVFQAANAYKNLRKYLVEDDLLYAVISLPAGVFNPYSGVKTSVLLMDKTLAKKKDEILFIKINNDGYDLGAQRRELKDSDIPEVIKIIKDYQDGMDVSDNALVTMAKKEDIAEQDYILVGERYKEAVVVNSDYPMVEIEKLINNVKYPEKLLKSEFLEKGQFPIVDQSENYIAGYSNTPDLLFNINKPVVCFGDHTRALKYIDFNFVLGADGVKILEPIDEVNTKYLYYCLSNIEIPSLGYSRHFKILKEIKIPLPPLHIQEEIVKEIEGYQKIIDGARQVVENYKPTIKIDPSWEIKLLEDMVSIKTGKIDSNRAVENGKYPFFTCAKDTYYINEYAFDCEALMLAGNNATADYDVKHYKGKFNAYQRTYVITINDTDIVKYKYLKIIIENNLGNLKRNSIGSQTKYLTLGVIKSLKIPLPTLLVQQQIVEQVNEEMGIVDQNKRLIQIFEQKIKDKISEVWGE